MEMGIRIGELIKGLGISKAKFAEAVGTSASRVSNVTTGRNKPDAKMLENIMLNFEKVDARWLLTGRGSMFISEKATPPVQAPPAPAPAPPVVAPTPPAQQDLALLEQRADYLTRENELLRSFLSDLRQFMPSSNESAE